MVSAIGVGRAADQLGSGVRSDQGRLTADADIERRTVDRSPLARLLTRGWLVQAPDNLVDARLGAGDAQLIVVGVTFDSNGAEDFAVLSE